MTYTALAAETEVIENLREVLDGLQVNGRDRQKEAQRRNVLGLQSCLAVVFAFAAVRPMLLTA